MQFPVDWQGFDEDDLAEDLQSKASELGALQLLHYLEETLSNALLLSERFPVRTIDPEAELKRLFNKYISGN